MATMLSGTHEAFMELARKNPKAFDSFFGKGAAKSLLKHHKETKHARKTRAKKR